MTLQHFNRVRKNGGEPTLCELEAAESDTPSDRPEPTRLEIARRAYQIYLDRSGAPGGAETDWLQAEIELRGRHAATARAY